VGELKKGGESAGNRLLENGQDRDQVKPPAVLKKGGGKLAISIVVSITGRKRRRGRGRRRKKQHLCKVESGGTAEAQL